MLRNPLLLAVDIDRRHGISTKRRPLAAERARKRTSGLKGNQPMPPDFITVAMNASHWWRKGARGRGVRVAIFDTGLGDAHSFAPNVVEIINFTDEPTTDDTVGHSTFMTGTISSRSQCPGGLALPTHLNASARVHEHECMST